MPSQKDSRTGAGVRLRVHHVCWCSVHGSADIKVDADVVDTLVSLGIIEGFEDGSFQPNATVTRAQMAKMIYVLRTGKSDASAYNDDKTSFTDIGSHWHAATSSTASPWALSLVSPTLFLLRMQL